MSPSCTCHTSSSRLLLELFVNTPGQRRQDDDDSDDHHKYGAHISLILSRYTSIETATAAVAISSISHLLERPPLDAPKLARPKPSEFLQHPRKTICLSFPSFRLVPDFGGWWVDQVGYCLGPGLSLPRLGFRAPGAFRASSGRGPWPLILQASFRVRPFGLVPVPAASNRLRLSGCLERSRAQSR